LKSQTGALAPGAEDSSSPTAKTETRSWLVLWSSFFFALVQSLCTAVLAISGIRVVLGLTALAAAAGVHAPARGFHQDAVRIPMMTLALAGSVVNLYVLWHLRRLRNRPSARWRQRPLSASKKRSERWQFVLSVATLVLLAAEWITHPLVHRVP